MLVAGSRGAGLVPGRLECLRADELSLEPRATFSESSESHLVMLVSLTTLRYTSRSHTSPTTDLIPASYIANSANTCSTRGPRHMFAAAINIVTHRNYPAYGGDLSQPRTSRTSAAFLAATTSTASSPQAFPMVKTSRLMRVHGFHRGRLAPAQDSPLVPALFPMAIRIRASSSPVLWIEAVGRLRTIAELPAP
ncbi:hypothetical protein N431DRAFT_430528 [Stipitochalara longipes BDJ]|nr:hypothetical protein N431DRAFT_430528 [Stipitochalara longipes BDJ]